MLQERLKISNGVNIGLSNNIIVPLIVANNGQLFNMRVSNIRLINSQQSLNNKFCNKGIKNDGVDLFEDEVKTKK